MNVLRTEKANNKVEGWNLPRKVVGEKDIPYSKAVKGLFRREIYKI